MGTPGQTSHKETSSGNTRKQLWDFQASEAGAVMEEGVLPLAFVRGHRPKEKLRGPVASFKILTHLGGSYQTLPGSMGMRKTKHFERGREVSQKQVRKAGRALQTIAQGRDSTPDSEVEREKREKEKNSLSGKEVAIFDQSSSSHAARVLHLDEVVNLDMPLDQTQEVQTLIKTSSAKNQQGGNNREENPQMSLGQQQLVTQSRQDFASIFLLLLLRLSAFNLVFFLSTLPRMSFKENQSESKKTHDKQEPQQKKLVLSDLKKKNFAKNFIFHFAGGARTQINADLDPLTLSTQPRMHLRENEKKGSQNFEGEQKQSESEEKTTLAQTVESVESMDCVELETRVWPGEELSCKAAGMERGMDRKTNLYVKENLIQIVAE